MRKRGADIEEAVIVAGQTYYVHKNGNWIHDQLGPDRWYLYHHLRYLLAVGEIHILKLFGIEPGGSGGFSFAATASASDHERRTWHALYLESVDKQRDIF